MRASRRRPLVSRAQTGVATGLVVALALPIAMPRQTMPPDTVTRTAVPMTAVPMIAVPRTAVPRTAVPSDAAPGTVVAGHVVPGNVVPGNVVPGNAVPGNVVPGNAVPGNAMPASSGTGSVVPSRHPAGDPTISPAAASADRAGLLERLQERLLEGLQEPTGMSSTSSTATATASATAAGSVAMGAAPGEPAVPFGSHQSPYAAGTLSPTGSQSALDQAVINYYHRWKAAFVTQNCGHGWYQVASPDADHPYVAEAQGYGMVVVATMAGADPDARVIFDGMVSYMLAHPSVNNADLLAAEQDAACRSVNGSDSATDGDLDVAIGLLLADTQWGSAGTYDYKALAIRHINAIKASEVNPTTHLMLLGDWSTPGTSLYWTSRPSDSMIGHFRAFARATGDAAWDTIRVAHQDLITNLQNGYAADTGLLPDFVVNTNSAPRPAPGEVLEDPNDGRFWWNSCRTHWRIGADAVTSGDAASLAAARMANTWIRDNTGGDPDNIAVGYTLRGVAVSAGSEPAYFAPFAVAAMTDEGAQAWLDALWTKMINTPFTRMDYYSTTIQLQVMIIASGNYWLP